MYAEVQKATQMGNVESNISRYYSARSQAITDNRNMIEPYYTLTTMADPYSLTSERIKYLHSISSKLNNGVIPKANIMKATPQTNDYGQQQYGQFNFDNQRFTAEEFKDFGDLLWKGLTKFSRFFSAENVSPADHARLAAQVSRFPSSVVEQFRNGGFPGKDGYNATQGDVTDSDRQMPIDPGSLNPLLNGVVIDRSAESLARNESQDQQSLTPFKRTQGQSESESGSNNWGEAQGEIDIVSRRIDTTVPIHNRMMDTANRYFDFYNAGGFGEIHRPPPLPIKQDDSQEQVVNHRDTAYEDLD